MRRQPEITRQGHWHVDYIRPLARGRRIRAWEIGTEQKRPHVSGYTTYWDDDDRWLAIDLETREGSLGFRDGEDGSRWTEIKIPIPAEHRWARWWRQHVGRRRPTPLWTIVSSDDKWAVHVVAVRLA